MRIAYLLMVHRKPEQVRALLLALPPDAPVLVHVDRRVRRSVFEDIAALRAARPFDLVRRHRCYWGRIGMVRATLELSAAALRSPEPWDYATLLSGADYPIKSNAAIAARLEAERGAEFMSFWDMRSDNPWSRAPGRMQSDSRVDHRHIGAGRRIVRLPWRRGMALGLHPFGGSQWWTLSRSAIEYVVGFVSRHPSFLRFMRGVFVPDECFFQTVLGNSPFRERISGDDLRFVDWSRPGPPYPAVLTSDDVDVLASSPNLYARKFDLERDPAVFKALESIRASRC